MSKRTLDLQEVAAAIGGTYVGASAKVKRRPFTSKLIETTLAYITKKLKYNNKTVSDVQVYNNSYTGALNISATVSLNSGAKFRGVSEFDLEYRVRDVRERHGYGKFTVYANEDRKVLDALYISVSEFCIEDFIDRVNNILSEIAKEAKKSSK